MGAGLCVLSEALFRATIYLVLNKPGNDQPLFTIPGAKHSFAEVMFIVFFGEIVARTILHLLVQLVKYLFFDLFHCCLNPFDPSAPHDLTDFDTDSKIVKHEHMGGIHGAVKDGVLATFSPLGFQSRYLPSVLWFYFQNLTFILLWFSLTKKIEFDTGVRFIKYEIPLLGGAFVLFILAAIFQVIVSHLQHPIHEVCIVRIHKVPH